MIFIIDTILYTALWQNNTLHTLLQKYRPGQPLGFSSSNIEKHDERLTAIDRAFDETVAHAFDNRPLQSFDGALLRCPSLKTRILRLPTAKQDNTAIFQSIVSEFPTFLRCTMARL